MAVIPTVLGRVSNGANVRVGGRRAPLRETSSEAAPVAGPSADQCAASSKSDRSQTKGSAVRSSSFGGSLANVPDHELLLAVTAAANDRGRADRAFAEFYSRHKSEIYTYCLRMMGRDEAWASDVFQEVFIRTYERAGQFRAEYGGNGSNNGGASTKSAAGTNGTQSNVRGWLYTIARNLCLNELRSRRTAESIDQHPMLACEDRSLAPEFDEEQHFMRDQIERAVAALPDDFREAFVLREFDGFSYAQIARMTGTSLSVTKVRIWRAKERLRTLLQPYLAE